MSEIHSVRSQRDYSAMGVWGAVAGLLASLVAWYRQDFMSTGAAIALYVLVPLALLALTVIIPRLPSRPVLLVQATSLLGFTAFCYGMFLLLLRQHMV